VLTGFAVVVGAALPAGASVAQDALPTAQVDGIVYSVAQVGSRTIIGGDFSAVGGVARRNAAAILPDGKVDPSFDPRPDGTVFAVAGSEDGSRIFLGGTFASVGATPRASLAAVDPVSGAAIPGWQADTDEFVYALEVKGTRLYAGGTFRSIGGAAIRRLASLDVGTAAVDPTFNPWPDWTVKDIAVAPDGTKVYATGGFTNIGGQHRVGAAEVLATTGKATAFDPAEGGVGIALGLTPDGSRFFFSTTNNRMYAYDPAVSSTPAWVVQTSGDTQAIGASATEVYFGGHFSQLSTYRLKRQLLASVRVADGSPTNWAPALSTRSKGMGPWAVAVTPDRVIVGGDFLRVNNKAQSGVAFFAGTP
jgi:hypothetical protein